MIHPVYNYIQINEFYVSLITKEWSNVMCILILLLDLYWLTNNPIFKKMCLKLRQSASFSLEVIVSLNVVFCIFNSSSIFHSIFSNVPMLIVKYSWNFLSWSVTLGNSIWDSHSLFMSCRIGWAHTLFLFRLSFIFLTLLHPVQRQLLPNHDPKTPSSSLNRNRNRDWSVNGAVVSILQYRDRSENRAWLERDRICNVN